MSRFIDRKEELNFLERKYKSNEAELLILYGRRRIGKTELLLEFLKNKKGIYFLGRLEAREQTIRRFNNILAEFFKDFELIKNPLNTWDSLFDYIAEKAKEKIIVVFDEFPLIIEKFPEIISILQDKWDNKLKHSKIKLILCGSSIGMMEKYTLSYKSPLYGRRTGQWMVDKIQIKYLPEFFPSYSLEDLILVFSCLDTIPGYLVKFDPNKNVWENIKEKILTKGEFLYEEVEILLREEFRDLSNYLTILSAIASGANKFNEIHNLTLLDKSLLSKYLYVLEELKIIEREYPIIVSAKKQIKRKGFLYILKDNFFDFWLRYVYTNKQELERGEVDLVLEKIKKEINSYIGRKFEYFVKEFLIETKIFPFTKIGKWWHKDKEIDIVALNEQSKEILFAECKWQNKVNAKKICKELAEKSQYVQWHNEQRKESFAIFAKSFSKKITEFQGRKVYCFDLKDLEKMINTK
ncbi:MAG TPA: ATP-binding protein, partial [Nanoarchaeota archaeon]|nr:ATP-binding protein [Nanoarchaeota archaeon]